MRPCAREDLLCAIHFLSILGMDGDEDVPFADLAFVLLGFVFRNAESDQRSCQAANGCTEGCSAERCHDRTGRDEWADSGDRERADADQPAKSAAENSAR